MRRRLLRPIVQDAEATEVIEERVIVAPGLIEEEVSRGVTSETERIGIEPDGTVIREYDRVEQEPVRRRRGVPELGWALLVLLVLVITGLAVWWFFVRAQSKQVPGVTGVPLATAVNRLQSRGFKAAIANQSHAERPGIVFAQSPGAGREEKKGSTVQIFVSRGPATVVVPNAVGLSEATARDRIATAGFKVTEIKVFSQQPAGTVTAQNPAAGGKTAKGATIRINVSKGTGIVIVPNVVGQTLGTAETQLATAGLTGAVQFHVQSAQPAGTVVAQNPPGGQARQGSKVELNVSRGAANTPPTTTTTNTTTTTPSATTSPTGTTVSTP